ncbi:hypothetical protein [Microbacterium lacticum]|uniref:Uncharacterized protein n=1 Tax=Microbacterium lacticum TaxID=33885 RepID=A0A4Y3UI87_9MICO|nr:hypothetical protein [Microbacterium lacticum]TQN00436.1 hypothetical protein FHX68_0530 [Microbacterium lacticum]GEB94386.1 hypothetical protein MLA01_06050 [Microbacterium lacticum]GGN17936.1 hypothetical protein GCM10009724_09650 [Microbacterium lacticum]
MAGYTVGINSETKAFKQGIDSGIIAPLEDAQDELLKLGKSRGPEELERAMKDAQDETKRLERETKDTADAIEKEYKRAYREAKDSARDGMGKAGEAGKEFKDETLANLSEVTSSFNGSMESVGDLVQGTLGGLTQGLGPALGGAAAAAAAGIGVITEAFTNAGEAADEARDSAFQFAYDVQGALDNAGYTERVAQWTSDTEKLKQAQDIAKVSGQDVADVIDALASGGDKLDGLWAAFEEGANTTDVASGRALELESALKGTMEGYLNGGDAAKLAAKLTYEYATSVGEATGETDDLGNAIMRLPDGKEIVVDANTKTAYEDIDAIEKRRIADKTIKLHVDTSDWDNYTPKQKYAEIKAVQAENATRYIP